jgi:hypothetical protein
LSRVVAAPQRRRPHSLNIAAPPGVWKTPPIARIDHTFSIDRPPEVTQAMFVRDVAPELAKDRGFQIVHERPGQLVFSDGSEPSPETVSLLEGDAQEREEPWNEPDLEQGPVAATRMLGLLGAADNLAEVLPRHIRVDFTPEGSGTSVRVHGHVEHDVRHGLELLGTARHWPEIADEPHD